MYGLANETIFHIYIPLLFPNVMYGVTTIYNGLEWFSKVPLENVWMLPGRCLGAPCGIQGKYVSI